MQILIVIVCFLVLDGLWLGVIAKKMYVDALSSIMRMSNGVMQPAWPAAVVVYVALIVGILVFVIPKANANPWMALLWGAVFGLVTYATYDFTNLAILAKWTLKMSIIDSLWGMVLCGLTSFLAVLLTK